MKIKILYIFFLCFTFSVWYFFLPNRIQENKLIDIAYSFINYPYQANSIKCKSNEYVPTYKEIKNFDCVTFVETVLAQYETQQNLFNQDFQKSLQKIRYKNAINSCENRNHFFVLDLIKNNPAYNITNISQKISCNHKITSKKVTINKSEWFKENHNINIKKNIEYLTIDYIKSGDFTTINFNNLKNLLPTISLMAIIGQDKNIDVNHVGFLIKKQNKIVFLHASYVQKKVIEENIFNYLSKIKKNKTLLGIAVFQISHKN